MLAGGTDLKWTLSNTQGVILTVVKLFNSPDDISILILI